MIFKAINIQKKINLQKYLHTIVINIQKQSMIQINIYYNIGITN